MPSQKAGRRRGAPSGGRSRRREGGRHEAASNRGTCLGGRRHPGGRLRGQRERRISADHRPRMSGRRASVRSARQVSRPRRPDQARSRCRDDLPVRLGRLGQEPRCRAASSCALAPPRASPPWSIAADRSPAARGGAIGSSAAAVSAGPGLRLPVRAGQPRRGRAALLRPGCRDGPRPLGRAGVRRRRRPVRSLDGGQAPPWPAHAPADRPQRRRSRRSRQASSLQHLLRRRRHRSGRAASAPWCSSRCPPDSRRRTWPPGRRDHRGRDDRRRARPVSSR